MCRELLRVKQGEKADIKFISGYPHIRPGFSASALQEGLGEDVQHALVQEGFKRDICSWLKAGFSVDDLVAFGCKEKKIFVTAVLSKIDVKVQLKLDEPQNLHFPFYSQTRHCHPNPYLHITIGDKDRWFLIANQKRQPS